MLDAIGHIQHAKHNEQLAEFLDGTPYLDWRATSLFYAALHYVQGYLMSQAPPQPYKTHSARDAAIRNDPRIGGIWNDYRSLKDWSQKTRYDGEKPGNNDFKNDILKSLQAIKKAVHQYLTIP